MYQSRPVHQDVDWVLIASICLPEVPDSLISYLKVGDLHNSPTVNNNGTSPVLTGRCWLQYEVQRRIFTTYVWSTMIWPASEMVLQHFHRFHFIFCCILDANIYQLHIVCTSIKKSNVFNSAVTPNIQAFLQIIDRQCLNWRLKMITIWTMVTNVLFL